MDECCVVLPGDSVYNVRCPLNFYIYNKMTIELQDQNDLVECSKYPNYAKFKFEKFNPVQSRIFEIYNHDCNVVVAAQTSAGKTVCSEMLMAREIRENGKKAIYLAPLRALAKEKIDDWTDPSHHFGDLNVSICTGDYRLTEKRKEELENADVIVMTSEMLNSRCRNYKSESNEWLKQAGIIVIDEAHLLTVAGRGDHLESGLMKFTQIAPDCRIVALSATMPNVKQISEWISDLNKKETYLINSIYRPCPLTIHYEEYEDVGTYEMKEESKIDKAIDILREHKDDKFLIFVHTKNTGEKVRKQLKQFGVECEFHNADLEKEKRHEVEHKFRSGQLRAIIATSTLAWGLNLPARRVIITGVHRGTIEVPTYDIAQMAGRAGRPGYDPKGDVYILLPNRSADDHIERLSIPQNIDSQLLTYIGDEDNPHYKTLAFHLVSEIHHGEIKTISDIHNWYDRSLARFQSLDLDDSIVDKTIELLIQVGAIKEVDGKYEATSIGKVSSMFYYSPFDVSDLRRNFRFLFMKDLQNNDVALSMALGNVDSIRMGFVTKSEKEEMGDYQYMIKKSFGDAYLESSIKGGYAYYKILRGEDPGPFVSMTRGIQLDFDRTASVLNALDTMAAKWNKKDFFNTLALRIAYGVRPELVQLCKIPNIGRVRAEKLYSAGFRKPSDLLSNQDQVKKVLNMKDDKIKEIIEAASSVH
jgi:replicative superfamily II helicase